MVEFGQGMPKISSFSLLCSSSSSLGLSLWNPSSSEMSPRADLIPSQGKKRQPGELNGPKQHARWKKRTKRRRTRATRVKRPAFGGARNCVLPTPAAAPYPAATSWQTTQLRGLLASRGHVRPREVTWGLARWALGALFAWLAMGLGALAPWLLGSFTYT